MISLQPGLMKAIRDEPGNSLQHYATRLPGGASYDAVRYAVIRLSLDGFVRRTPPRRGGGPSLYWPTDDGSQERKAREDVANLFALHGRAAAWGAIQALGEDGDA